jgi:hypothetical protein
MTLPATGPLSMTQIAAEADVLTTSPVNLGLKAIRNIARRFTIGSTISYSDLRGKSRFTFQNGSFTADALTDNGSTYTTPGWTVYRQQVRLNGVDTILGYPTPTDNSLPSPTPGDNTPGFGFTYSATLTADLPSSVTNAQSIRLVSTGTSTSYGIIHGPYLVTNTAVELEAGDIISFWWKAQGGDDAFDIFAYLLNTSNGSKLDLLNQTGDSTGATTDWAEVTKTISASEIGNYKFVFVSGSYDFTGGTALGASLYVTVVQIKKWFNL